VNKGKLTCIMDVMNIGFPSSADSVILAVYPSLKDIRNERMYGKFIGEFKLVIKQKNREAF